MQTFQAAVTRQVVRDGLMPRGTPVWQRGYYEHIIRNEREMDRITRYIESNPLRWNDDDENELNPKDHGDIIKMLNIHAMKKAIKKADDEGLFPEPDDDYEPSSEEPYNSSHPDNRWMDYLNPGGYRDSPY